MTRSIGHRGPDDEGYYIAGPLGFGFRRLSIIDLAGGHQPMSDQEESVWVIFNGEIYNFQSSSANWKDSATFSGRSRDTEVIIHGYKQWGDDVLNHLNGMFGLAIWDVRKQRLVRRAGSLRNQADLLQDRWGSAVFRLGDSCSSRATTEKAEVDPVSLNLFLRYRYTPSPYTIFKGVRKLAPGTMLVCRKRQL